MLVAVMDVREVRVAVQQWRVHMRVAVRFFAVPWKVVAVLVVLVVAMTMLVCEGLVRMFMRVPFADMQPDTQGHQCTGQPEGEAGVLAKQQ